MRIFRELEEEFGKQVAANAWGEFTEAHWWFSISPKIEIARTSVHDELEAYKFDAMNLFIHLAVSC